MGEDHETTWRRSSRCGEASCVEVADGGEVVLLRRTDTTEQIAVSRHAFQQLIEAVKTGELDGPATS